MKYIKKYEAFDFDQTIPITTKNFLTNFYSCDECNSLWKEFNNTAEKCRFCDSDEIEELQEDEWYEISKSRMTEEESKELQSDQEVESEEVIDLVNLKKDNKDVN